MQMREPAEELRWSASSRRFLSPTPFGCSLVSAKTYIQIPMVGSDVYIYTELQTYIIMYIFLYV